MRFVCDSCHAQYQINDDRVGPNGVLVRCKKCGNKIVVKKAESALPPPEKPDATVVVRNPMAMLGLAGGQAAAGGPPPPPPSDDDGIPDPDISTDPDADGSTVTGSPFDGVPSSASAPSNSELTKLQDSQPDAGGPPADSVTRSGPNSIEEDIGRAFDSVLSGTPTAGTSAPAMAASSGASSELPFSAPSSGGGGAGGGLATSEDDDDLDRQSTRVVNLAEMAGLIKSESKGKAAEKNKAADHKEEKKNGSLPAAAVVEWFVAVNDSQIGPLDLEGVRKHWDKGELSADSLVWHVGMSDWKPLSTVPELADVLAPVPKSFVEKSHAPAGATATGVQAPAMAPLPPPQESAEPEWKPSAANALESLVQQELQVLEKPKEPEPEPAAASSSLGGGLMGDLPDLGSEKPPFEDTQSKARAPLPKKASMPASRPVDNDPYSPTPSSGSTSRPIGSVTEVRRIIAAENKKTGLYLAIAVFASLLVVAGLVVVVVVMLRPQQPTMVMPPGAVAAATQPQAPDIAKPEKKPVEPEAPKAADAPKVAEQPKAPEPPPEPAKADVKAPEPPKPVDPPKVAAAERRAPPPREPAARAAPAPARDPDPEPPPRRSTGNKVDDDFDKIFGNSGGGGAEPAPAPAKKKVDVYIPPAPGQGAGAKPGPLGQGDIMEVVLGSRGAIKKCTDDQKAKEPDASGVITMKWIIRNDGGVSNIQTDTAEFQRTPLSQCLTGVIKGFKFPAYSGAQMQPIKFPFKF